MLATKTPTGLL